MPDGGMPQGVPMIKSSGEVLSTSRPTSVTAAATANTKGTWTAIGAVDWERPHVGFYMTWRVETSADYLVDIGYSLDSGTTWHIVLNNLLMSGQINAMRTAYFPLYLPRGARIGARAQCSTLSSIVRIVMDPVPMNSALPNGAVVCDTNGANTADSGGTSVDPGATINTKGAWVQFAAFSVIRRVKWLALGLGNQANAAPSAAEWLFDVAYETGGTNRNLLVTNLYARATTSGNQFSPDFHGWFPVNVPGGSSIYIRSQCSINDATDRLLDAAIYTAG